MLHFLLLFLISNVHSVLCINPDPGKPVPNADILDELLSAHINTSYYNPDTISEYILGNDVKPDATAKNLALSVLDVQNVRKIISKARRQFLTTDQRDGMGFYVDKNNSGVVNKSFDLMRQNIYQARFRIRKTKPVRDQYARDYSFKVGLLHGASRQLALKMDNVYSTMRYLPYTTHFVWYLVLYEQMLAQNVDITDMVRRMFMYHAVSNINNEDASSNSDNDKEPPVSREEEIRDMFGGKK